MYICKWYLAIDNLIYPLHFLGLLHFIYLGCIKSKKKNPNEQEQTPGFTGPFQGPGDVPAGG
jgi:hypothetical protein